MGDELTLTARVQLSKYSKANFALRGIIMRHPLQSIVGLILLPLLSACGGTNSSNSNANNSVKITLNAIAYGSGVFVGVGGDANGAIAETSTDGVNWGRQSGTTFGTARLTALCASGSGFLAVDYNGVIYLSRDGSSWTAGTTPIPAVQNGDFFLSWDGSEYLISNDFGGGNPTLYKSSDGKAWTPVSQASTSDYATSVFTNVAGTWYGVAPRYNPYSATFMVSSDLVTWTPQTIPFLYPDVFSDVIYASGQFLGVGSGGLLAASADGINWTRDSDPAIGGAGFRSVAWNGSVYVAVGETGGYSATLAYSLDGVTWNPVDVSQLAPNTFGPSNLIQVVAQPNGLFVAIGFAYPSRSIASSVEIVSLDGVHWSTGHP